MTSPARHAAYELLCRIEIQQAHSDNVLHSAAANRLAPIDRNLVTEIVYGTLRWRGWLDHILQTKVARPWAEIDENIRILLRMSLYQMARMDRIPDHAAINDAVEIARLRSRPGSTGFVNGVLRNLARRRIWQSPEFHRDCPMWVRASLPEWLWNRWQERFGAEQAFEYAVSLNRPPRTAFRFRAHAAPEDAAGVLPSEIVPGCFIAEEAGLYAKVDRLQFQDEASQLIPYLLGSLPGGMIWDACAAPGGKTLILMDIYQSKYKVIASDMSKQRAIAMKRFLEGVPTGDSAVVIADVRQAAPFRIEFDAILADVPCSGTGTLRRNPEIKWRLEEKRLPQLAENQTKILESVAASLKSGGRLLYSTCSTEPEENEQVVCEFLSRHAEFQLIRPTQPPGIETRLDARGFFRTFPGPRLWDGFFAALLQKKTEE